jgi:GT2 family glycosyltransferase
MTTLPVVAVVIVNWNGRSDTLECLASLRGDDFAAKTVIVVDNGSTDGSPAALRAAFPEVVIIETGANLGFTGGNNAGIAHALALGAENIFLLNNDTVVEPGTIAQLAAASRAHPEAGLLTPVIHYYDRPDEPWFAGARLDLARGEAVHDHAVAAPRDAFPRLLPWVSGCAMFLPAAVLREVRGFDDRFFLNWEDVDLSLRIVRTGRTLLLVPAARLAHKVSRSLNTVPCVGSYYHTRNRLLLLRLHGGRAWPRALAHAVAGQMRLALRAVRRRDPRSLHNLATVIVALWDGLTGNFGPRGARLTLIANRLISSFQFRLRQIPALRNLGNRYGRSYWRLSAILRRRIYWEASVPQLRGARTWRFGRGENVKRVDAIDALEQPTIGHRLAAHSYRSSAPFVTKLDSAWLVGRYASPVTLDGRLILSAFRDEPRMLGLEPHPELESWLQTPARHISELPEWGNVWPMVNRLQTNYFHWIIEWCGRLELIEAYRDQTGCAPKLIIPEKAPGYVRESLTLLGFGSENWIPWPDDSAPRKIRDLVLPSFRGTTVAQSPAALQWLRDRFLRAVSAETGEPRRKIYISRPRGGWRSVLNDDEIVAYLRGEGFDIVEPHRLTLAEQIRQFSEASLIVSLHGSGLTNVLFAPHAAVLELFGAYGDGVWFGMSARLWQPYEAMSCQAVGDDVIVNLEALKQRVRDLTKRQRRGKPMADRAAQASTAQTAKVSYV